MDIKETMNFEIINVISDVSQFTVQMPNNLPMSESGHKHVYVEIVDVLCRTGDDCPVLYLLCDQCNVCFDMNGHSNNIAAVLTPDIRVNDSANGTGIGNLQYKQTYYKNKNRISFIMERFQQQLKFSVAIPAMFQLQNAPLYDSTNNLNLAPLITRNTILNAYKLNDGTAYYQYNNFIITFNIQFLLQ